MLNKSRILLGVMVLTVMFGAVAFFSSAKTASADCTITATLRVGSSGPEVSCLQTKVGATADGAFGPLTKASVMAYQSNHGLSADGVVGPLSRAVLNASVSPAAVTFAPTGCTNASGYSPLLGLAGGLCHVAGTPAAGCLTGYLFDPMTGASCTGAPAPAPSPETLTGGAGDADVTHYATSEKNSIKEGEADVKVLGFKVEAIDSDIAVSFVKVEVSKTAGTASEKISSYLDSVDIYKGTTKVGSVDASDLSRDSSTSPDIYSKTIALSNVVVKEGDKDAFYVAFNAADSIDDDDIDGTLTPEVVSIRMQDATGAIFTIDATGTIDNDVTFDPAGDDDQVDLKSSTNNPDDATITVDENNTTDKQLALAFKFDVGDDSSDVTITEIPVDIVIAAAGGSVVSSEAIIDSVVLEMDGQEYTADVTDAILVAGAGTADYSFDLSDEDVVFSAGDVMEGKIYITFVEQDGNYAESTTVTVDIAGADILAETDSDDTFTITGGTQTGAELTLSLDAATVSGYKWVVNATGTMADFEFTVEASDGDFDVLAADILDSVSGTASITNTTDTPETSDFGILSRKSGDSVVAISTTGFTVAEGDTTTFKVRYSLDTTTDGLWAEITVTSVAGQNVPDDKEVSPTATVNVN